MCSVEEKNLISYKAIISPAKKEKKTWTNIIYISEVAIRQDWHQSFGGRSAQLTKHIEINVSIYSSRLFPKQLFVLFTYPNPLDIEGMAAEVWCWRMHLMSDPSLPALPVSNISFHSSHLPGDRFSMKSMLPLVPTLQLQTPMCLLGPLTYLLSSSSSLSLLFCSPFQVFPSVFVFSSHFFFQVKTGGSKQPGSFPLLFILFLVFSLWLLSLYPSRSVSLFLQIEPGEVLDLPFWRRKVGFGVFSHTHMQTQSLVDLVCCWHTDIPAHEQIISTCAESERLTQPLQAKPLNKNTNFKLLLCLESTSATKRDFC